mmetsp:Transcript_6928/g.31264  ORF Transcript_6928/g.31264 Transcript_6928/m.31264 type:complete len:564 (-) Transcript_6928:464-2155(-)
MAFDRRSKLRTALSRHSPSALASAAAPSSPMEFLCRSSSTPPAPSPRENADAIAPAPASPRLLYPRSRRRRDGADARLEASEIRRGDISAMSPAGWMSSAPAGSRRLAGLPSSSSPTAVGGERRNPAPDSPISLAEMSRWAMRERRPFGMIIAAANADAPDTPRRVALRLRTSRLGLGSSADPAAHAFAMAAAPTAPRGLPSMNNSRNTGAPHTSDAVNGSSSSSSPTSGTDGVARIDLASAAAPSGPIPFMGTSRRSRATNASERAAVDASATMPSHPIALFPILRSVRVAASPAAALAFAPLASPAAMAAAPSAPTKFLPMFSERRTHPGDANASPSAAAPSSPTPQFSRLSVATEPSATSADIALAPTHPSDGLSPRLRFSGGARCSSAAAWPNPSPRIVAGIPGSVESLPIPTATASASAAASSRSRPHDASVRHRSVSSSSSSPPPSPLNPPLAPYSFAMSVNESAEPDLTSAAALLRIRAIAPKSSTFSTAPSWAARTSRRRTRTTGHASCWMSARHTPLDLTSTASLRNLDPAADIAACTCLGVQYPRSPSVEQCA